MFKINSYKNRKDVMTAVVIPKHIDKHNVKNVVKPNVKRSEYDNIRNVVENDEKTQLSITDAKKTSTKLNII